MTIRYKTQAIVFKKEDRNETDRIFSVFTNDFGRLNIFAKAIRKSVSKLRSGIDIFVMAEVEFIQGKNKKTLTDAIAIKRFDNIYGNPEKFKIANGIGEIINNFVGGEEKDQDFFSLINEVFCELNRLDFNNDKKDLIYYYFLWNAISMFGYKPEIRYCSVCRKKLSPSDVYFSNVIGGTLCKDCLRRDMKNYKINSDVVKIMRLIFNKDWTTLAKVKIETASKNLFKKVSNDYYLYTLSSHSFKNILNDDGMEYNL